MTYRLLLLGAAVLAVTALVLFGRERSSRPGIVADAIRTPGVLNPDVTPATLATTICAHGWTRTVRPPTDYTNALKRRQMRAYGETGSPSDYQEDHLISLELGGNPTDPRNLWPEPYPRAAEVDKLENELNDRLCSGAITLDEAQRTESALKHRDG